MSAGGRGHGDWEVAIIGMAGRFPGAEDLSQLWHNLCAGVESIELFSDQQLEAGGIPKAVRERPHYVRAGGAIAGEDLFDAAFFGFTPREAELLDPQQRLFLECAWEAFEDAGYDPQGFTQPVGVYAGTKFNMYLFNLLSHPELLSAVGLFQALVSNDKDHLATRVSYKLGLTGPSVVVQTACSTSLAAVHLACQGLLAGECDLALAGGVSIAVPQRVGYLHTEGGILSPDGHCRAFDAQARGTVNGHGLGAVVLRRLRDAIAAGDEIRAVVKASAMNNDGALKVGYTAPSLEGQAKVVLAAQALAEVEPESVTYVEAHGTGTALGDPIEIAALTRAFGQGTGRRGFCAVGSVKTNIGHLDVAAGIAGLIKTVLALQHGKIPPSLHFTAPNPEIDFAGSPFYVNASLADWQTDGAPRRAGVSSFGIGGTNVHAVLEEAPAPPPSAPARPWQLLVLSARSQPALATATRRLAEHLAGHPRQDLADVAYTLQVGRQRFAERRVLVCRNRADALAQLAAGGDGEVLCSSEAKGDRPLAFLFPGQGAQWPGMGRELYESEPVFRGAIDLCADALRSHLALDLRSALYPDGGDTPANRERLTATAFAQPALFATEYALARLWMAWGLEPEVMAGHSVGEYVAACLAGVLAPQDAVRLVAIRGELMQQTAAGGMLAVALTEAELAAELGPELALAAVNGPHDCVAAGPEPAVESLCQRLEQRGVRCRRLRTSHAFHSPLMEPALTAFGHEVGCLRLAPPRLPLYSNLTGALLRDDEATDPGYWVRQLRGTVRFGDAVAELWRRPDRILLEVGPGRALSTLARQHPGCPRDGVALASLPPPAAGDGGGEAVAVLRSLARLWLAGVRVDWVGFHARERRRRVALPTYPFERRRHWIERRARREGYGKPHAVVLPPDAPPAGAEVATVPAGAEVGAEPAADRFRSGLDTRYVAPRTDDERAIAAIWEMLIGLRPVGIHDDFFALGGGSLLATQLSAQVGAALGVDLPLRELLANPTVAGMAALVAARRAAGEPAAAAPPPCLAILPEQAHEPFPLTEVQQAYWIGRDQSLELGNVATHFYREIELAGLDLPRLEIAWRRLVDRHPMLRAVVLADGRQRVLPAVPPYRIEVLELADQGAEEQRHALAQLRERMSHQVLPADLWPLFEIVASRLPGGRIRLHLSFDFLIGDAWSLQLLLGELGRFYRDPEAPATPLDLTFRDYVLAEERSAAGPAYERALAYWRGRLSGLPAAPQLPLARPPASVSRPRFARRHAVLAREPWERLKTRAARAGLTASGVLLAAFSDVLAVWSAEPSFTLSVTLFNRPPIHPQIHQVVGDFTSLVLLAVEGGAGSSFAARAQGLQRRLWEDLDHRQVSGVRVLREWAQQDGQPRGLAVPVVFTSLLGLDAAAGWAARPDQPAGLSGRQVYSISQTPQVLIDHQVDEVAGSLVLDWDVVDEVFPPGMIDEMFAAYGRHLERLAAGEEAWQQPRRQLLAATALAERAAANSTAGPLSDQTLHALVAARAAERPHSPAVIAADRTLTYEELARRARRLAGQLQRRGARPNRLVAVVLEKGWQQVVAALAVLEAGAAYLPLDPALPGERLHHLLRHGEVEVALTVASVDRVVEWPDGVERLWIEEAEADGEPACPEPLAGPDDLAYVIFTSGSTGLPKGVMIDHRGAVNTLLDVNQRFAIGPADRVLGISSLSFDLSVYDVLGLLAAGGALVLPDAAAARDAEHWAERMRREGVTVWNSVPALLEMLLAHAGERTMVLPTTLRLVLLSGDWIPVELPARLHALAPQAEVISLGGATEASIWSIYHRVEAADAGRPSIPYGRPLRNQTCHVLDDQLEPRPVWVPGDFYIGGSGLARGYWRDAAKTRASFFVHPESGERLYRAGDRGRYLPGGEVEFLGRRDLQVKLHGQRIELGEIEATLAQHPAVAGCAASIVGERAQRRLLAWAVCRPGAGASGEELAAYLRRRLPAHLVPAAIVCLDRLPLTANGKLDRAALVALQPAAALAVAGDGAARGAVEEILCGISAEVLGRDRVADDEDFFAIGGHSLLATTLLSRVRETFAVELPLRQVFESPTMAALAPAIERARRQEAGIAVPPIAAVARGGELPLSFAQQRLWFLKQLLPASPLYNVHVGVRCSGRLAVPALRQGIAECLRRHEILRTVLPEVDGRPLQVVLPAGSDVALPVIDLAALPAAAAAAEADRLTARQVMVPFDLASGPLVRWRLLRLAEREQVLLFLTHHVIWDDWSQGILLRELAELYRAFAAGRPSTLPALPVQYADYACWQRQWLAGESTARHLDYWRRQLAGVPQLLPLPTDRPRPAAQSYRGRSQTLVLPLDLTARIKALNGRRRTTLFMTLVAAFKVLCQRYTGQSDLVVGTLTGNRNRPEIEGLIGFFVNTLALRTDLAGEPPFSEVLARVREVALAAYDHQDLPFEKLVEALKLPRGLGFNPLTQVVFNHFNAGRQSVELPELTLRRVGTEPGWAPFDLSMTIVGEQPLACEVAYATDLYDASSISRLGHHFQTLLAAIAETPELAVSWLPLLSAAEHAQLVREWSDTDTAYPRDLPVPAVFEEVAARRPDAIAVAGDGLALSYGELNARANQLAALLRDRGVGHETRVGLHLQRTPLLPIAMLAVLKAGGAYVPLDPTYPPERLRAMLADSGTPVVVSETRLAPAGGPLAVDDSILLDRDASEIGRRGRENLPPRALALSLAYVMYTSGSTGRPKGVAVVHRGIVRLVKAGSYARLGPDQVVLQLAPASFDASTLEIWAPLLHGGRLVLFASRVPTGEELAASLGRHGITLLHLTAGLCQQIIELGPELLRPVGQLLAGGDTVSAPHVRRLLAALPGLHFVHCYGPTEGTTFASCQPLRHPEQVGAAIPIGRPIGGTRMALLDAGMRPVPIGIAGDLYVGGDGLARGYLDRPDATARQFLPDATGVEPGGRLYRTGDRARFLADGRLLFLGRLDHQVKVRGFRVELGEIEAVLRQHLQVREAVVVAREDAPGSRRLVAYAVTRQATTGDELLAFLRQRLPEHMVPSALLLLAALPLDPNGKIDRQALPPPQAPERRSAPPRNPVEATLARIWQRTLGLDTVCIDDNFFALGGDSILIIQVIARAREAGLKLAPSQFFVHQTIAELAAAAPRAADESGAAAGEPPIGPVPLLPVQRRFFDLELPAPHNFNHSVLLAARDGLDAGALAAAVAALVAHHDALRLRFARGAGGWWQWAEAAAAHRQAPFTQIVLAAVPLRLRRAALEQAAAALQRSLDLEAGPLLRVACFVLGDQEPPRVLLLAHHLAVDVVSWHILLEDLANAYLQLTARGAAVLPGPTLPFGRWATLLAERARSAALRSELDHWLAAAGADARSLPRDAPAGANLEGRVREVGVELDAESTHRLLREVPAAYRTHVHEVLLTALALTLARWTGCRRSWVDLEGHGREDLFPGVDLSRTVGWFTAIFPAALEVDPDGDPGTALKSVKEQLRAIPGRGIGYGLLRYLADDPETRSRLALLPPPEISFNYLGQLDQALAADSPWMPAAESVGEDRDTSGRRPYLVEVEAFVGKGRLRARWRYGADLHRHETIAGVARDFIAQLEILITHCAMQGAGGFTPADFPAARVTQLELDRIFQDAGQETP
jgi:amino acid adenylation domain-containing protein/non-ribosomal peptide synthase protein (TIGR01720 family)